MKPLRIAYLTPEFVTEPYFAGGLASYLHRVTRALAAMGHEPIVVVMSKEQPRELTHEGVRVVRVPVGRFHRRIAVLTRGRLVDTPRALEFAWRGCGELRRLHRAAPLDLVQAASFQSPGVFTRWLLPAPQVTRISSYRPMWWEAAGRPRDRLDVRLMDWLERLQFRQARYVIGPSQTLRRALMEREGVREIEVIPTPVAIDEAEDPSVYQRLLDGRDYALFVGRLQLHKGVRELAEAAPAFFEREPRAHLAFAGLDGPTPIAASMEQYIRERCGPLASRVIFTGPLPRGQLFPVVRRARLVVLPSLVDNLPNAMLEAMALGRPVLGTIGTSLDEVIVDGRNGYLVPPSDAAALGRRMLEAWRDPRREEIGVAALESMRAFSIEQAVGLLLRYYRSILPRRAADSPLPHDEFAERAIPSGTPDSRG